MAFLVKDRVKETTSTVGTSSFVLTGAVEGYQSFSNAIGDQNTTFYCAQHGNQFEVGSGTYSQSTLSLSRDVIHESSNSGNKVDFGAGVKHVFCTYPAERSVYVASDDQVNIPGTIQFTTDPNFTSVPNEGSFHYSPGYRKFLYQNRANGSDTQLNEFCELGDHYIHVWNATGSSLPKGSAVMLQETSSASVYPNVVLANATDSVRHHVDGIVSKTIPPGSSGIITVAGLVRNINTAGIPVGKVYLGSTDGAISAVEPPYPAYSAEIGYVLSESATDGNLLVRLKDNHSSHFRINEDLHIGNDLIIEGNLSVLGTQTIAATSSIRTGDPNVYLASGDTIGEDGTTFTGTGLDDGTLRGNYSGATENKKFTVKIDTTGTPDSFSWLANDVLQASNIAITGEKQALEDNISIQFEATTGHTLNDQWEGTASPINVDTGLWSHRNSGEIGVGFTHIGLFFDVSDEKWRLVNTYDPDPLVNININHATYSKGKLVADIDGDLTGNASTVTDGVYTSGAYYDPYWLRNISGEKITSSIGHDAKNITDYPLNQNVSKFSNVYYNWAAVKEVWLGDWQTNQQGAGWKVTIDDDHSLVFAFGEGGGVPTVDKMKLDKDGNLTVVGNVTAYGTL